jgi:hypothetical protein
MSGEGGFVRSSKQHVALAQASNPVIKDSSDFISKANKPRHHRLCAIEPPQYRQQIEDAVTVPSPGQSHI